MTQQINTRATREIRLGLPTERGNTLECRIKFFMGCREASQKHEARSIC